MNTLKKIIIILIPALEVGNLCKGGSALSNETVVLIGITVTL